jgi:VWFA-related protein
MTRVARFARGLVVAAAVLTSLDAQEPPAQFRGRTDLITLDVTVLDRDRRPVRGLTAEDFVIVDGGSFRPVTGFAAVDLPGATTRKTDVDEVAPDVATNAAADGRLITIMFDHSIPAGWGAQAARRVAHSIVEQLGPNDRAAIVFSDRTLSQSFTNDRSRLVSVIDNPSVGTTLAQAKLTPQGKWIPEDQTGLCLCGLCSLDTITTVAESIADVSNRRKVLFFIGGYLPLNPSAWGGRDSPCEPRLPPVITRMFNAAQRANLTIYAFDPNGLVAPRQGGRLVAGGIDINDPQSAARDIETLLAAADHTGGRAVLNTNAPEERVVEVFEETGAHYLLGFEPPGDATPGSFRNVTVRVNRPGVDVLTRRGYYVPGVANAVTTGGDADPLMAAVRSLLPQSTMPMQLSLAAFPARDGSSFLALTTTIEREGEAPLELLAAAFDRTGQLVASVRHTVSPDAGASPAGTDEFFTRLDLSQAGQYSVRVAARDTVTGRIASVHDITDVPAFARDRLSLSGLVVHTARVSQRSIWALTDFLPVVPTTRRTFARDETVTVYAQVAQVASPTVVRMTARVFDGSGQALLEHGEAIDVATFIAGPTFYRLDLPLVRLTPGTYRLNVEAARDTDRVSRTMRFQVQ